MQTNTEIAPVKNPLPKYLIIALTSFIIGLLLGRYVFPANEQIFLGACENTDVGVTIGNPMQFMSSSSFMDARVLSGGLSSLNVVLVDSFSYAGNRIITNKRNGQFCDAGLYVFTKPDPGVTPTLTKFYDVSINTYVVDLSNNYWKIYVVKK